MEKKNNKQNKKTGTVVQTKTINLAEYARKVAGAADINVDAMVLKLKESGAFYNLPSWIEEYDVAPGTVMSSLTPAACLMNLMKWFKEQGKIRPPAYALETILEATPIEFSASKIKEANTDKVHDVKKCVLILEPERAKTTVYGSIVTNLICYYTQGTEQDIRATAQSDETLKNLGVMPLNLLSMRSALENSTRSVTFARNEIFDIHYNNPSVIMYNMSCITDQIASKDDKDNLTKPDESLQKMLDQYLKENNMNEKQARNFTTGKIKVMKLKDIAKIWRYLSGSRAFRGEDASGIGILTIGYYFFDMTRRMAKNIALAYDLMNLMENFKCNVMDITGSKVPEYVVRILVANGKCLIDRLNSQWKKGKDVEAGIFSDLANPGNVCRYLKIDAQPPEVKKEIIEWREVNYKEKLKYYQKDYYAIFCLGFLEPTLKDMTDVCLFPAIMGHNGTCYIGLGPGGVEFDVLASRCGMMNSYRNAFPYHRKPFISVDPCYDYVRATRPILLPKLSLGRKKEKGKMFEFDVIEPLGPVTLEEVGGEFYKPKVKAAMKVVTDEDIRNAFYALIKAKTVNIMAQNLIDYIDENRLSTIWANLVNHVHRTRGEDFQLLKFLMEDDRFVGIVTQATIIRQKEEDIEPEEEPDPPVKSHETSDDDEEEVRSGHEGQEQDDKKDDLNFDDQMTLEDE